MSVYKSGEVNLLSTLKRIWSQMYLSCSIDFKTEVPNWDLKSTARCISRFEYLYFSLISSHQYLRFKIRQLAMLRYKISGAFILPPGS